MPLSPLSSTRAAVSSRARPANQEARLEFLGIIGSLRQGSYNRLTFAAATELAPYGVTLTAGDIGGIPLFDQDVLEREGPPESVRRLKAQIAGADAVVICSPEYNYSMPGVLKNAIDWVSRPPADQPFRDLPVAIMGASTGRLGTARMQYHLRQTLVFLEAVTLTKPEVMIGDCASKFDARGRLVDETARELIRAQLEALAGWVERLR